MSEYKLKPLKTSERHDKKLRGEFEDGLSRSPAEAGAPGEAPGRARPLAPSFQTPRAPSLFPATSPKDLTLNPYQMIGVKAQRIA